MDAWRLAHFGFLCAWGGVLLVEFVLEGLGDDDASQAQAARVHFWIDVLVEIPILAAVLVTGGVLLSRVWPPSHLHLIKIASALLAIGLNLYCAVMVVIRYRARADVKAVQRYRRRVRLSALGVPFGAVALYLGFTYFL
jgi:hypothetical protein